ncbi:MAG: hypothetical protein Q8Q18_03610 [bacterium]|nr:hypothetical protein [bacterium]
MFNHIARIKPDDVMLLYIIAVSNVALGYKPTTQELSKAMRLNKREKYKLDSIKDTVKWFADVGWIIHQDVRARRGRGQWPLRGYSITEAGINALLGMMEYESFVSKLQYR